ncbi:MAG TPA: hypothetical protein VHG09_14025 [Longimicrobiales bacterium]|nr:hypothetical protein [Longimicrobiales bacterium]
MRARIFLSSLILVVGACSEPATDTAVDAALDERDEAPDLALMPAGDAVPVASDLEVHRPEPAKPVAPDVPAPAPETPEPMPEPLGNAVAGATAYAPAAVESVPVEQHVHPKAEPVENASGPSVEEGGGKPTGVSTGLGPVPDRNWGDTGIMDEPNPLPGRIGREGAVIIRGGAGGVDDDCAIHPRGGTVAGPAGPAVLVNDRGPRGGLINERAPRTSRRPSLPRGGGFPRGIR